MRKQGILRRSTLVAEPVGISQEPTHAITSPHTRSKRNRVCATVPNDRWSAKTTVTTCRPDCELSHSIEERGDLIIACNRGPGHTPKLRHSEKVCRRRDASLVRWHWPCFCDTLCSVAVRTVRFVLSPSCERRPDSLTSLFLTHVSVHFPALGRQLSDQAAHRRSKQLFVVHRLGGASACSVPVAGGSRGPWVSLTCKERKRASRFHVRSPADDCGVATRLEKLSHVPLRTTHR